MIRHSAIEMLGWMVPAEVFIAGTRQIRVAMKFDSLLEIVADEPVFDTGLLLSGEADPAGIRQQLARWTRAGRIQQLRRELYVLAPPYRKRTPHPFLVANRLVRGSYVSGVSALAHANCIPEYVPEVTSVGAGRPQLRRTPLGRFSFRHVKVDLLYGYRQVDLGQGQTASVALPEKALLDVVHLCPGGDEPAYIAELRLDFETLDLDELDRLAQAAGRPKLLRAARHVRSLAEDPTLSYEAL